ncbi:hypothetical protein SDC9_44741 [bioreactor metagenome]|uniref:Uncharacterized protein n=1 Tax=bioreactor metagenome TaxID=1076179 RepID=A0A644W475_9ZZZZ
MYHAHALLRDHSIKKPLSQRLFSFLIFSLFIWVRVRIYLGWCSVAGLPPNFDKIAHIVFRNYGKAVNTFNFFKRITMMNSAK